MIKSSFSLDTGLYLFVTNMILDASIKVAIDTTILFIKIHIQTIRFYFIIFWNKFKVLKNKQNKKVVV